MNSIIITNNIPNSKGLHFNVTSSELKSIVNTYQYSGSFKRFEIDLYDDNAKGKSGMNDFVKWYFETNLKR